MQDNTEKVSSWIERLDPSQVKVMVRDGRQWKEHSSHANEGDGDMADAVIGEIDALPDDTIARLEATTPKGRKYLSLAGQDAKSNKTLDFAAAFAMSHDKVVSKLVELTGLVLAAQTATIKSLTDERATAQREYETALRKQYDIAGASAQAETERVASQGLLELGKDVVGLIVESMGEKKNMQAGKLESFLSAEQVAILDSHSQIWRTKAVDELRSDAGLMVKLIPTLTEYQKSVLLK